jgi:hypothetical protein
VWEDMGEQTRKIMHGIREELNVFGSGQVKDSAALPLAKQLPYLLGSRLGGRGAQSRSGRRGEEESLLPLPGIAPHFLGRPAHGQGIQTRA